MNARDLLLLAWGAVWAHRLRSSLTTLGIVIGITSVILLTSLGEGTRSAILKEFSQFGTNTLTVTPGRIKTGGIAGAIGGTVRPLTIDDSEALLRVPGVEKVVPVCFGLARVAHGERGRNVYIYGSTSSVPDVWRFTVRQGRFLPPSDPRRQSPLAVLGPKLKHELFGEEGCLGEHVKIGGRRFIVIGVMSSVGMFLGFDLDDSAYIPVASAQSLFNRPRLMEIDALFSSHVNAGQVVEGIRRVLKQRHDGEEDFTVTTQTEMLTVADRVLGIISFAVGGIAAISLLVGAIGILTMMWISVGERTAEIGLARALGARPRQILVLFLLEAALLSLAGGLVGVGTGLGLGALLRYAVPGLPLQTPPEFVAAALLVSLLVGLSSGVLPARRAAALDPVDALHAD